MATQEKKKNPKKEKKKVIVPKYYGGTDTRKLPKVPAALIKDLKNLEGFVMSPQQREAYLSAIIAGLIPDKFGLEAGIELKIKAIAELNKMDAQKALIQGDKTEENQINNATELLFKIKKASEGIDK